MTPLTPKAVLEGRTRNRPSVGLIVGLLVAGLCLLLVLVAYLIFGDVTDTVVAVFLAVPTGLAVVGLLLLVDRQEPEPPLRLLFVFLWGAGVACLIALFVNTTGILILSWAVGAGAGQVLGVSVLAPIVEESLKGSVLLLLLWRRRDDIDGPTDGIIYAGMVGIGFAVIEDVNYYSESAGSAPTLIMVVLMRGLLSPLLHPLFTSMTGLGVAYAANHRGGRGALAVLGGWLAAVGLHAMWNTANQYGLIGLAAAYAVCLALIIVLVVVLVRDRRRVVGLIGQYLPLYDRLGIVTPADLTMLISLRRRAQARRWVRTRLGRPAGRAMTDYQLAATELALLHSHARSRTVSPPRFAFRQYNLVQLMHVTRTVFAPALLPMPRPAQLPPPGRPPRS